MFRVGATLAIVMVADELCCVSSCSRLLFASTRPEFIQQSLPREKVSSAVYRFLPPLSTSGSRLRLSVQAISTKITLCKLNGNREKCSVT